MPDRVVLQTLRGLIAAELVDHLLSVGRSTSYSMVVWVDIGRCLRLHQSAFDDASDWHHAPVLRYERVHLPATISCSDLAECV